MWSSLSVTCDRSVVFSQSVSAGFLHRKNWPLRYITEILLKVALNPIKQTNNIIYSYNLYFLHGLMTRSSHKFVWLHSVWSMYTCTLTPLSEPLWMIHKTLNMHILGKLNKLGTPWFHWMLWMQSRSLYGVLTFTIGVGVLVGCWYC